MSFKADILSRLRNDVLSLQGFKPVLVHCDDVIGLGCINQSFPRATFPVTAVHEFIATDAEEATAASAFIAGIFSSLLRDDGVALWIGPSQKIFPPALAAFGLRAEKLVFVAVKSRKEILWAVEEALRCEALVAVACEMRELSFTESRRFQLTIEKSGVPLFVLRSNPVNLTTAAVTRWHVRPLPTQTEDGLPGVDYPCWQVNLLKVRNGKPGSWQVQWRDGRFGHPYELPLIPQTIHKKTG